MVWTHKIQEKLAEQYAKKYKWFETVNIVAATFTACGIVSTIFQDVIVFEIFTALLSFVTVFISAYNKSFCLKTMIAANKTATNQLVGIRNDLLQIISELHMMKKDVAVINEKFVEVMERLNKLYVDVPTTTKEAVEESHEAFRLIRNTLFLKKK